MYNRKRYNKEKRRLNIAYLLYGVVDVVVERSMFRANQTVRISERRRNRNDTEWRWQHTQKASFCEILDAQKSAFKLTDMNLKPCARNERNACKWCMCVHIWSMFLSLYFTQLHAVYMNKKILLHAISLQKQFIHKFSVCTERMWKTNSVPMQSDRGMCCAPTETFTSQDQLPNIIVYMILWNICSYITFYSSIIFIHGRLLWYNIW